MNRNTEQRMNTGKINKTRNSLLLALAALIWGVAFVAQTTGGEALGPLTFGCLRWYIGAVVLIPVMIFLDGKEGKWSFFGDLGKQEKREFIKGSLFC